jgi:glyoxylase-like metal-dependent hydrolase (beta-lactamase superfamily II)
MSPRPVEPQRPSESGGAPPDGGVAFATRVLAPNPGPMTLDGTNSWVLRAPDTESVVVVDPGPDDTGHLERLAASGTVALVLLTHGHSDHAAGLPAFHAIAGRPTVLAADPTLFAGAEPLVDGQQLDVGGVRIKVLLTPGHSADSACFVAGTSHATAVLTGDTLLGRGTTVIAAPDGRLDEYLASLRALDALGSLTVLPGHGPVREDVALLASEYLMHRMERLEQVRVALQAGATTALEVVDAVYTDIDPAVRGWAATQVEAQLTYLRDTDLP